MGLCPCQRIDDELDDCDPTTVLSAQMPQQPNEVGRILQAMGICMRLEIIDDDNLL